MNYEFDDRLHDTYTSGDPYCTDSWGRSRRCETYTLEPTPHRAFSADLTWSGDSEAGLAIELMGGNYVTQRSVSSTWGVARILLTQVGANNPLTLRVIMLEGNGPVTFRLKVSRSGIY